MASSPLNAKHAPDYRAVGELSTKPTSSSTNNGHLEHLPLPNPAIEPPELVKNMSHEERLQAEKHLVRKIDSRLLPAAIIMYIMNYLDRNNIAAARIAGPHGRGLQDELGLTSTQYQVSENGFLKSLLTLLILRLYRDVGLVDLR